MARKILVVLDTNIFVSGLLSPNGVPGAILRRFRQSDFNVVTSPAQIKEIKEVLKRPSLAKAVPKGTIQEVAKFFGQFRKLVQVQKPPKIDWDFSDKNDHFLLDLVAHSESDFLVTGDKTLRSLLLIGNCAVVSPVEFIARL